MTKILMVCLGNICRSPLAEGILRDKLEKLNLNIVVDSAGTSNYHIGEHPDKRTIENAGKHKIDLSNLKARQFSVNDFDNFDFIFAMDSSNFGDVMGLARNKNDKQKVELILNRVYPNANISVPDPYFGGDEGFENVFTILNNACDVIASSLCNTNEMK